MVELKDIPHPVFLVIRKYFIVYAIDTSASYRDGFKEWRSLVNCNKWFASEIKRRYGYYNLQYLESEAYLRYHSPDPTIRSPSNADKVAKYPIIEKLNQIVLNPSLQISVKCYMAKDMDQIITSYSKNSLNEFKPVGVHAFRRAPGYPIEHLDFSACLGIYYISARDISIPDVSALRNSTIIELSGCKDFTNLALLGNVEVLNLSCTKISDVSIFSKVKRLYLRSCENVSDVSALGNLDYLCLNNCERIKDVSALGKLQKLEMQRCSGVSDLSKLGNLKELIISDCPLVTDISALGRLRRVDITTAPNITSFLPNDCMAKELSIDSCYLNRLEHFVNKRTMKLTLVGDFTQEQVKYLDGFPSIELFGLLSHITLANFEFLRHFAYSGGWTGTVTFDHVPNLETLDNFGCGGFGINETSLPALKTLKYAHVSSMIQDSIVVEHATLKNLILEFCSIDKLYLHHSVDSLQVYMHRGNAYLGTHLREGCEIKSLFVEEPTRHDLIPFSV